MNKLIKEICKREAKKSQVSVGNVREVLKHTLDILSEESGLHLEFWSALGKRAEKKAKRK